MQNPIQRFLQLVRLKSQVNVPLFILEALLIFMPGPFQNISINRFIKNKLKLKHRQLVVPDSKIGVNVNLAFIVGVGRKLIKQYQVLHARKVIGAVLIVLVAESHSIPVALLAVDFVRVKLVRRMRSAANRTIPERNSFMRFNGLKDFIKNITVNRRQRIRNKLYVIQKAGLHLHLARQHLRNSVINLCNSFFKRSIIIPFQKRQNSGHSNKLPFAYQNVFHKESFISVVVALAQPVIFNRRIIKNLKLLQVPQNRPPANLQLLHKPFHTRVGDRLNSLFQPQKPE